jgi:hypothetical protein
MRRIGQVLGEPTKICTFMSITICRYQHVGWQALTGWRRLTGWQGGLLVMNKALMR